MASTIHSRPAASSSRQVARNSNLPTYQPLTHKLNPGAEHALRNLPTTHSLNELKRRLQTAVTHLTEVTGDLNDQHQIRKAGHEKQKARQAARDSSQGSGNTLNDEADRRMEDASREADDWTGKMERGTRNVIDIQARVEDGETALREMNANISQQGRGTATQSTLGASQHRPRQQQQQQRRARNDDDDDGVGDSSNENEEEEGAHTGPSPLTAFKTALTASSTAYASLSLQDRYAAHNDYIGFRKILHDALHPNDDTPLPHASTWFPTSSPQTTTTNPNRRRGATSPSSAASRSSSADDDIQIAREKRSIRCPITLLPMHDPLTSTLCPHSFERSAILSMLDSSAQTARGGQKAMNCPECEVLLTAGQLKTDAVL
ncbi:MAG: hypothetical protein LQ345_006230, partial [Seirophora villosa]